MKMKHLPAGKFAIHVCNPQKVRKLLNHFSSKKLAPLNAEKRIIGTPLYHIVE
jgi:hypothetical protein